MEGWLQAVPREEWASACLTEGTGGQNTPSFRLQVLWGLAAFGAPIWMTSIMSTWVPVLGRLSRPHQVTEGSLWAGTHWGSRLGTSGVRGMDAPHLLWGLAGTLSSQGLKFPTYKMGLSGAALGRREREALEPPQHSGMAGVPPKKKLTGWQGCHGGSDQALDAQGAESATQEAAGEGQELGCFLQILQARGHPDEEGEAVVL